MEKLRRIRYTQEFKLQAVKMVDEDGLGVAEVVRRLEMAQKIRQTGWRSSSGMTCSNPDKSLSRRAEEIPRLCQENLELKIECEILKNRRRTSSKNHFEVRRHSILATWAPCPADMSAVDGFSQCFLRVDEASEREHRFSLRFWKWLFWFSIVKVVKPMARNASYRPATCRSIRWLVCFSVDAKMAEGVGFESGY